MNPWIKDLLEFHSAFELFTGEQPVYPDISVVRLRDSLLKEECKEARIAIMSEEFPQVMKENIDVIYVALGNLLSFGLQDYIDKCWDEVHKSNMSKLGEDGKPVLREDGKVTKGLNYSAANIKSILEKQ